MPPIDPKRAELISRLSALDPPSSEACFVLLWSYLTAGRVSAAESLYSRKKSHFQIDPYPRRGTIREELASLPAVLGRYGGAEFDLTALRWLIALDKLLNERGEDRLAGAPLPGVDGVLYRVRRLNNFLAASSPAAVTGEADQSGSRATHIHFHKAVPEEFEDFRIDCRPAASWGDPALQRRLQAERTRFKALLWPFELLLDYPGAEALSWPEKPEFVHLDGIRNEEELQEEVRKALTMARDLKATVLIFPELAIPARTELAIQDILAGHGPEGHPILTLFGCCHRPAPDGGDLNEAVLLGPDGTQLDRHRKIAPYSALTKLPEEEGESGEYIGEQLERGDRVSVLECALGNLTPLICLEFFHGPLLEVLRRTHGNLFVVPSLSPKTNAHRGAATKLQASNRANSFVCNRWLKEAKTKEKWQQAASFYQVHGDQRAHQPDLDDPRFLLFSLSG